MIKFINLNENKSEKLTFNQSGDYLVFFYNLSGRFLFDIKTSQVNLHIYGIFIGKETDQFTISTIQHHQSSSSFSNLFIKGVFFDQAKFNFEGLIRIEKEAQKTYAYQKNQNLLFSSDCFVQSKPNLEILANDVFCTHGSTTGRLDKQQLFYLATRNLNDKQARAILIHGFINEVFDKMRKLINFHLFKKSFLEIENVLNILNDKNLKF